MDKKLLKEVVLGLEQGQKLTVNFLGEKASLSGEYLITEQKRGRGKGGSYTLMLKSLITNEVTELSTPRNNEILNMVVDGKLYGYESESEVPITYETNAGRAVELKLAFQPLLAAGALPREVVVKASTLAPEIDGSFTVSGARQIRGRHGQIILTLTSGDKTTELWSHRHSGVVESFALVPAPAAVAKKKKV